MTTADQALKDFVFHTRYARAGKAGGYESMDQAVDRVRDMHVRRFPALRADIHDAFEHVRAGRIMPSMRSMQFGGKPIEVNELRGYNCASSPVDRMRFWSEYFYLLLCGTGCGFSVQDKYISKLPPLVRPRELRPIHYLIGDSIEGWADAVQELIRSYMDIDYPGGRVEFDYSLIRPKGAPIRTAGGMAPGPEPLRDALEQVRKVLDGAFERAAHPRLKPIEAYDMAMFLSKAVLSGGIRRSASICLFDPWDTEMMEAKTGEWHKVNSQRAYSNNSAVLDANYTGRQTFSDVMRYAQEYGEPGFFFAKSDTHLTNPCCEIALEPFLDGESGWAFCNLTSINLPVSGADEVGAAALIGTLQAAYTDFPYLTDVSRAIAERDALLGVSLAGIQDIPHKMSSSVLALYADSVRQINSQYASKIGINEAARLTTVKPDGTVSKIFGCASGIHRHPGERYIRRIRHLAADPLYLAFRDANPGLCEPDLYDDRTGVVSFPIEASGPVVDDQSALDFLRDVLHVQRYWVQPGRNRGSLDHAVSNTCMVRPHEWDDVEEFIWQNRHMLAAVSLFPYDGDTRYAQAPQEVIRTPEQHELWEEMRATLRPVDYSQVTYNETTPSSVEPACAGGQCEL